jgi:chorismate dehydratase
VDLGLTPSIEYLHAPDYRFVPGNGIGSRGAVTSVALYARKPIADVRSIALDTSSRTSVALTRVLCHDWFKIAPTLVPQGPNLEAMTAAHDAALLIGDPALEADERGARAHEDRPWRGVAGDDRAAVRLCRVDRPGRAR